MGELVELDTKEHRMNKRGLRRIKKLRTGVLSAKSLPEIPSHTHTEILGFFFSVLRLFIICTEGT